ncbi:hypothetical protein R3W88_014388 [Solanum pinnatisectum]|uniref:DNA-directed RNA polymerase n=1 Tax=Solanum pinnatisectum TaxID=50273 RepID=A0AAV9KRG6_9SOLN|nr:hypothetical protein R3W88_014388 [Solanum pinnatisectum]
MMSLVICQKKLIPTPQNSVTSPPLTTTYGSFFGLHPLSQVLDQTNPLTQIVHGRKLSYLGPGGLTGRTASFWIQDIHPSHYGRKMEEMSFKVGFMKARKEASLANIEMERDGFCPAVVRSIPIHSLME